MHSANDQNFTICTKAKKSTPEPATSDDNNYQRLPINKNTSCSEPEQTTNLNTRWKIIQQSTIYNKYTLLFDDQNFTICSRPKESSIEPATNDDNDQQLPINENTIRTI